MPSNQLKYIFESLPDGVIACDRDGKILRINATALKLFEVPSEHLARGTPCEQFLHSYQLDREQQQQAISLELWLMSLLSSAEATAGQQEEIIVLQLPSGRKVYVNSHSSPLLDAQKQAIGTVYVLHDITHLYRKERHLRRVHEAMLRLTEAIAHIPEPIDFAVPEATPLLSPPVHFVARHLVDVLGQVLKYDTVSLIALGSPDGHLYYAMEYGFTAEQEQYRWEKSGRLLSSQFVDEKVLARLTANQEVILPTERLRLPTRFKEDFGAGDALVLPLFLEKLLAGALMVTKAGLDSGYTPEEIEFVKAVATEAMLVIENLRCLNEQAETRARALVLQEVHHLFNDFLDLASHELNTSLTVTKGNIQLAQRRLVGLKRKLAHQPEYVSEQIEQVQQSLALAASSTRVQEHIIKELIDDARIQANTLELHPQRFDLIVLLKAAVTHQQRLEPERTIVLDLRATEKAVPIIADAERITHVINSYLVNALHYAPADQPVTVQLTVEDAVARVTVHDEGPGIPFEEQERIWERFYHAREITGQHELDLSLGLGLYLCQAFIERHRGSVGVQSEPGRGATFWFTLPIETSTEDEG